MVSGAEQIERMAMRGEPLPDDLSSPDQLLYLSFRSLYREYQHRFISRDQASLEKQKILAQHELSKFYFDSYVETAKMRNRLSSQLVELERCGCEHCKKAVLIFDGRADRKSENAGSVPVE